MPSKKLSKIGLTLLLAASFSMPFSFPARADFTSTDSNNLRLIQENTSNTVTRLGTIMNNYLADIKTDVASIDTNVQNIKTAVANTITTTLNGISTTLTSIKGYVDGLEGYVDGIEGKLDNIYGYQSTLNSNLITLGGYVQSIDSNTSANGSEITNIYNILNNTQSTLIGPLMSIRRATLIMNDNISINRSQDNAGRITVENNNTLGLVDYPLQPGSVRTFTINADGTLNITNTTKYMNFRALFSNRLNELFNLQVTGFQYLGYRLYTDLGYIGDELHLTYQLIDDFKDANHTDIIAFKDANHTDIIAFKNANHTDLTKIDSDFLTFYSDWRNYFGYMLILVDNFRIARSVDDASTINLTSGSVTTSYNLQQFTYQYPSFSDHHFTFTSRTKYVNSLGRLHLNLEILRSYFNVYIRYLEDNSVANSIANNVAALDNNLTNYSAAEQQIQNRVQNAISTFIPDTQLFGGFVAIAWCSQYLQQVYVALESYGTVIMIGLLLGVCMQFIGYFRYKY